MSTHAPVPDRSTKAPLVAIIGTTGVGKSQLGIDLARWVSTPAPGERPRLSRGEVINADSMQVYKGLDVITNKVTEEEKQGVMHHLMGFLEPGEEYKVGDFQKDAIAKVSCAQPLRGWQAKRWGRPGRRGRCRAGSDNKSTDW